MQTNFKHKLLKFSILFFLLFIAALLFINPQKYIASVSEGLNIWALAVLPSLLPFFIITKSITALNIVPYNNKIFKVLAKIFKVPECGIYIFFMSILSGYPVGAKLIEEFYKNGTINEQQATKLVAICSTSGPLFIVGTVGTLFLRSTKLGFILLISHILGAIFNGLMFRKRITENCNFNDISIKNSSNENVLYNIMINSILSVLVVGSYIAIFYMIIDMVSASKILIVFEFLLENILRIFNINDIGAFNFIEGLIEVTRGCKNLGSLNIHIIKKAVITSLLLGFGGFCVHMQSITFLKSSKVKLKFYFFAKITQAIFSAISCYVLMLIFI